MKPVFFVCAIVEADIPHTLILCMHCLARAVSLRRTLLQVLHVHVPGEYVICTWCEAQREKRIPECSNAYP